MRDIMEKSFHIQIKDIIYKIDEIHPLLELKRESLIDKIKYMFTRYIFSVVEYQSFLKKNKSIDSIINSMFSKCIINALSQNNVTDPVIPCDSDSFDSLYTDFYNELYKTGKYNDMKTKEITDKTMKNIKLYEWFSQAFKELYMYYKSDEFKEKKKEIKKDIVTNGNYVIIYYYSNPVKITKYIYDKAYARFKDNFEYDKDMYIWCLCKRYEILSSMNNQLAVHPATMKDIKYKHKINFELFGSVFNTYNKHYCSMFYDIEKYFGSYGSFYDIKILSGNFSMNPPFDYDIIKKCSDICNDVLKQNAKIFMLIWIPIWDSKGVDYIYKKCNDPKYEQLYAKYHKKTEILYEGFENIKNSKYYKHIRSICNYNMTYLDYNTNKKKHVVPTYLIAISNNKFNNKDIEDIIVKR